MKTARKARAVIALDESGSYSSVTQYETTCVSAGGVVPPRSILSVRCMPVMQFIVSVWIDQHGLFVDEAGVPALLHCGSTVSVWFALPKFAMSETEQSY